MTKTFIKIDEVKYLLLKSTSIINKGTKTVTKYKAQSVDTAIVKYVMITKIFDKNKYTWTVTGTFASKEDMDKA